MIKLHSVGAPKTAPMEYLPVTAEETVVLGEALVLSGGTLTACAATSIPEFISVGSGANGAIIPVIRVIEDMEFGTTLSADGSRLVIGDKVTLSADSTEVTATTSSGVFMITEILEGGATGTGVRGMFRR